MADLKYLLLQIRDADDPIRPQEIASFARALGCSDSQITALDLLEERLTSAKLDAVDAVLIGGSGDYSAAGQSEWLDGVLSDLRQLRTLGKPTFASCWGFQALGRALGGRCIHDPQHAELGTIELTLSVEGKNDPLFGRLDDRFAGLAGHEDHVIELPEDAILLASSNTVTNQAFKFPDALIYCTQFHPELELPAFLQRIGAYPQYVQKIAGTTLEEFSASCRDAPQSRQLLKGFADLVAAQLQAANTQADN